ncbi:MAG: conjugal transfer protein [Thermoleophilia bacterium]|nr:conjugal transfer protein [Thermoleophilia bacterium]
MEFHAREQFDRRAITGRSVLAATGCALVLAVALLLALGSTLAMSGSTANAATMTKQRDAELRAMSDAELNRQVTTIETEATAIGERMLRSDFRRDAIVRERDVARRMLGEFMAESYKQGSVGGDVITQVLSAGSLSEAADRARVADAVGSYHLSLVDSLDTAEVNLDVSAVERARLITKLSYIQSQLVDLRSEQQRRDAIRSAHAEAREQQQAEAEQRRIDKERAAAAATASLAGSLAASTGGAPGALVSSSPFVAASGPPTAAGIDAYLASKGSPMTGQGAAFMASAIRWRVDPRLLVAISGAESSFGQVTCGPNNAWGWACPNDPADFATWADGIDTVTEGLRGYYLDEGRTSVSLIQQKYCPVGAANDPTGLNSHWSQNVTKFLLEQGGNPAMVGPGPSGAGALQLPDFGLLGGD